MQQNSFVLDKDLHFTNAGFYGKAGDIVVSTPPSKLVVYRNGEIMKAFEFSKVSLQGLLNAKVLKAVEDVELPEPVSVTYTLKKDIHLSGASKLSKAGDLLVFTPPSQAVTSRAGLDLETFQLGKGQIHSMLHHGVLALVANVAPEAPQGTVATKTVVTEPVVAPTPAAAPAVAVQTLDEAVVTVTASPAPETTEAVPETEAVVPETTTAVPATDPAVPETAQVEPVDLDMEEEGQDEGGEDEAQAPAEDGTVAEPKPKKARTKKTSK